MPIIPPPILAPPTPVLEELIQQSQWNLQQQEQHLLTLRQVRPWMLDQTLSEWSHEHNECINLEELSVVDPLWSVDPLVPPGASVGSHSPCSGAADPEAADGDPA